MCQTGMQRINLQPETKIWKCPGGPGGMFLTPNSFSDLSDPTWLTAVCPALPGSALSSSNKNRVCGCSRAGTGAPSTAKSPRSHLCYRAEENSSVLWKAQECTTVFQEKPGAVRVSMSDLLCLADRPLLLGCSCQRKTSTELRSCI